MLHELLHSTGLAYLRPEIERVSLPSIRLKTRAVDARGLKPGDTKFGGAPDLPYGMAWPEHNGWPLPFVAQINLLDVAPYDIDHIFPNEGIVYFFFDVDTFFNDWDRHQTTWHVWYTNSPSTLHCTTLPEMILEKRSYHASKVTCSLEITLPDYSQYDEKASERLGLSRKLTDEEEQAYYEIQAQISGTAGATRHTPIHRLLGHADTVQWDMSDQLPGPATVWQLLLQVDSDDVPATDWGDTGRIYYWIRREDLQRRDFSQVQLILQST